MSEDRLQSSLDLIGEKLSNIHSRIDRLESQFATKGDVIALNLKVQGIEKDLTEIRKEMVTEKEFKPIRTLFYGCVGSILLAFLSGVIALVLKA